MELLKRFKTIRCIERFKPLRNLNQRISLDIILVGSKVLIKKRWWLKCNLLRSSKELKLRERTTKNLKKKKIFDFHYDQQMISLRFNNIDLKSYNKHLTKREVSSSITTPLGQMYSMTTMIVIKMMRALIMITVDLMMKVHFKNQNFTMTYQVNKCHQKCKQVTTMMAVLFRCTPSNNLSNKISLTSHLT